MPTTINPLRYPGAKRSLSGYINDLLCANNLQGCVFYEPYAGSAAVGLDLLIRKTIKKLVLCEKDLLLYAFWESVFRDTDRLCDKILETEITLQTWLEQSKYREFKSLSQTSLLDCAFAGLFLNRTNFSGILKANPIGGMKQTSQYGIDCRFNKSKIVGIIRQLSTYRNLVEVHHDDALHFMTTQQAQILSRTSFAYFDPPYYEKGSKIYRHYYTDRDHFALSQYVRSVRGLDWIISYDDAPFICGIYSDTGAKYQPFFLDYTCSSSKKRTKGRELLISNLPLPPFSVCNAASL